MRVLVTNDDGLSDGIRMLAGVAARSGCEVVVAAPSRNASGSSASLAAVAEDGRSVVQRIETECDWTEYTVEAPPAFIVRAAIYGAFGTPPDAVLSGINRGLNTGRAIIHSGTVGAALTASTYGRRALAVSASDEAAWEEAAELSRQAIGWLMRCPDSTVLNLNVPDAVESGGRRGFRGVNGVKGVKATTLAVAGVVQGALTDRAEGGLIPVTFTEGGPVAEPGTDAAALADGYASVTAVRPVCEDERFDLGEVLARYSSD